MAVPASAPTLGTCPPSLYPMQPASRAGSGPLAAAGRQLAAVLRKKPASGEDAGGGLHHMITWSDRGDRTR
jgi:hypothetical protein